MSANTPDFSISTVAMAPNAGTISSHSRDDLEPTDAVHSIAPTEWLAAINVTGNAQLLEESSSDYFNVSAAVTECFNQSVINATMEFWNDSSVSNSTWNTSFGEIEEGKIRQYPLIHNLLAITAVAIVIVTIVLGNALVILAIAKDRNLKSIQNWFIASLAVSDLCLGLLIMPFSLAEELMDYWFFGQIMCDLWLSTDVMLCTASILNLCLISLDRYWSITRAVSYVKARTRKRAMLMIATVWILSMIICFPPLVGWKRPQPVVHYQGYNYTMCVLSDKKGYVIYSTMGSFYIPLVLMVIVYFKIYIAARSRARRNLKSKVKAPQNNGKSTSTTTTTNTTTTSFGVANKSVEDLSSVCEEPALPIQQPGDSTTDAEANAGDIKLSVANPQFRFVEEKKKLLSDDTDSVSESPGKFYRQNLPHSNKQIQFGEDTDSMSDCSYRNLVPRLRDQTLGEDNMRPLLEDSQLESDSQRDSDARSKLERNISVDTQTDEKPDSQECTDHETATKPPKKSAFQQVPKSRFVKHGSNKGDSTSSFRKLSTNLSKRQQSISTRDKQRKFLDDTERHKRKLAKARERRATIVLGIIMATFIGCWLPFFSVYLVSSIFELEVPDIVFAVFFWAGYCNSALNPIIYTVFNREFRAAFIKLMCGRRRH